MPNLTQGTFLEEPQLRAWIAAFILDREVQHLSKGTITYYRKKLKLFADYCQEQGIAEIQSLTPNDIRRFLAYLKNTNHNPGGVRDVYRAVKAFLRWYDAEVEPDNWPNPINKVKIPKSDDEKIEPASLEDVAKMIDTCQRGTFMGERDRAILYGLVDTGARAQEFLDLEIKDVDLFTGKAHINKGKGGKGRDVYFGSRARRALRNYLKLRDDDNLALWVRDDREELMYEGLREIIKRRAKLARLEKTPNLHDFRRAFAINMLRGGTDIKTVADLLGHKGLAIVDRYLKTTSEDGMSAHKRASPVDNMMR